MERFSGTTVLYLDFGVLEIYWEKLNFGFKIMEAPTIDLTEDWAREEDEFVFPLDDALTDQILADLDLDCQQEELLRDFPKCSISLSTSGG